MSDNIIHFPNRTHMQSFQVNFGRYDKIMTPELAENELARLVRKMSTAQRIRGAPAKNNYDTIHGAYLTITKGLLSETWFLGTDEDGELTFHFVGYGDGNYATKAELALSKPIDLENEREVAAMNDFVAKEEMKKKIKLAYKKAKAGDWKPMAALFRSEGFDTSLLDDEVRAFVADKIRKG